MQFLPRQQEVPGWRLTEDPLVLPASALPEYLDQASEQFKVYDAVDLTVGEYQRVGTNGHATVEIFRFPDFVKAFGAYSTRRKSVVTFLDIPNEAFVGPHSIHIWRGPFYVRMIGAGARDVREQMKVLAAAVAERMPAAPGKPAVFQFLPVEFRVINSETFSAGPAFGHPSLANAFTAQYLVGGEQIDGLILPAPTKPAAINILDRYRSFFATNGRLLDPVPNLGEDNFTAEDRYAGRTVAFRIDRFVIAFRGYGDKQKLVDLAAQADQKILGTIRKQLESAEKRQARPDARSSTAAPWQRPPSANTPQNR